VVVLGRCPDLAPACAAALADAGHRVLLAGPAPGPAGVVHLDLELVSTAQVDEVLDQVADRLDGHGEVLVTVPDHGLAQSLVRARSGASEAEVHRHLSLAIHAVERMAPAMASARWGRLVFVSGIEALRGAGWRTAHAAAMAGLVGLARSAARELGPRQVTANVVAAGVIDTAHVREVLEHDGLPAQALRGLTDGAPLNRIGEPRDVADAVRFLVSERASFVTGAVVPVDGGLGMGRI
jgi:3-oxoacyl-[acyl-carrier protein] reductase